MTNGIKALQAMFQSTENPRIRGTRDVSFGTNHHCLWCTGDGSTSICKISNTGDSTLTFVVSGASKNILATNGKEFTGVHSLPPNQPTAHLLAVANFQGSQVTIFNVSATESTCNVATYVPSSGGCDK